MNEVVNSFAITTVKKALHGGGVIPEQTAISHKFLKKKRQAPNFLRAKDRALDEILFGIGFIFTISSKARRIVADVSLNIPWSVITASGCIR